MESVTSGMRKLRSDAAWFARATELRLLHVSTTGDLGAPATKLCAGQEYHADNKSLFFTLEEESLLADDGWYSRTQTLRKQYGAIREAQAKVGIQIGELSPSTKRSPPVAEFAGVLAEIVQALSQPIAGVVVVLSPRRVEVGSQFPNELRSLIATPGLRKVRWIVIERDVYVARDLVQELAPLSLQSEWFRDERAEKADLAALIGPIDSSLGLPGVDFKMPAWQPPGAGPDVEAPPRKDAPAPPSAEDLKAQGLSAEFVLGGGQALQKLLLGAALAMKEGRPADAVRMQTTAADLCGRLSMPKAQILNTLILGSYFLAAQAPDQARQSYQQARTQAAAQQMKDEEVHANLSLGMLDAMQGKPQDAMAHYSSAGEIAEASGNHALAIESFRTAGQLAFGLNAQDAALHSWLRALNIASKMPPAEVKGTSASEAARGVATICRARGQNSEAVAFEERGYRLQHGLDPSAPLPPPA